MRTVLSFSNVSFLYDPYPIGIASPVIEDDLYKEMILEFPPIDIFRQSDHHGRKYLLSLKNHRKEFQDYVASRAVWREFFSFLKSNDFIFKTIDMLRDNGIDLGMTRQSMSLGGRSLTSLRHLLTGHLPSPPPALTARLEFSVLPADGGKLLPHTDTAKKVVTLVVSMVEEGEWNPEFGGGTEVMKPKDMKKNFNFLNQQLEFEEVDTVKVFEFKPNQAVVFVKTFNSLHGVKPMTGVGSEQMRRTLTINIAQDI